MIEDKIAAIAALPGEDRELRNFVLGAIGRAVVRRGVSPQDLQAPAKNVYAPAMEALRYVSAREELGNIIAATMDVRTGHRVLPAYVEVIKQVSNDELQIIRQMPKLGRSSPITHVNVVLPSNHSIVVYRNVVPEALAQFCAFRDNIPQYIDNLTRLGLISIKSDDEASASVYRSLARLKFVREFLDRAPEASRLAMTPLAIALTDFGEGLRQACFD